ncbi:MAG: peptidase M14, partial [Bacteroidota bacterium]
NEDRANAMKVIVFMNSIIQKYAPGQVGRYSDDFEPRAFGDNIQKWGTSTILIESGGYTNDIEKQEIRKLNYVSILSAIYTIAKGNYVDIPIAEYEKIPHNDRKLFDLKIQGATYKLLGKDYILDLGMNRLEVDNTTHDDFYYSSRIIDQGDLSTYYGYETFDASGYTIRPGTVYSKTLNTMSDLSGLDPISLLKSGYTYVRINKIPVKAVETPMPLHVIGKHYKVPELRLEVGKNPTFLLEKDNKIQYAVINGFLLDLNAGKGHFRNAMIYR